MTTEEFVMFVERVCLTLEELSRENPERIAACNTGEKFEECVAETVQVVINANYHGATIHYTPGSHAFPDIVVEFVGGERYGIEVKSSSSATSRSWKINGNSVLGSTKENVLDTYIVFGKTARGHQAFRYKRYEDAVANVGVTHSPRYLIDLDIAPEETFFAKSGLSYQEISQSDNPIGLITDYFRSQGQQAWWLGEDRVAPAIIRMFGTLSAQEKEQLISYCFVHFPEVFSAGKKKYYRSALWLTLERSVVSTSLRDNFSASGKVTLRLPNYTYPDVSRIYQTLRDHRQCVLAILETALEEDLLRDWEPFGAMRIPPERRLEMWLEIAARECDPDPGALRENGDMLLRVLTDE
ncbi:MAG TPA: hypothetical protein DCR38_03350 [Butyricimonas virosa]|nr:hypothetical protein [Butyricimonas virosa]